MSDEDNEDLVDVEISGTVRVYKVVQLPRDLAQKMSDAYGFERRDLVDREVVFDTMDIVELEDIEDITILDEDEEKDEEE